jgi:hypothetical protein
MSGLHASGKPAAEGRFVRAGDLEPISFAPGLDFRPVLGERMLANFAYYEPHAVAPLHVHEEEQIVIVIQGAQRGGGLAGGQVGPVGAGGQAGREEHPGVIDDVVVEQGVVAGHHADHDGRGEFVADRAQQGGPAAAGQADAGRPAGGIGP